MHNIDDDGGGHGDDHDNDGYGVKMFANIFVRFGGGVGNIEYMVLIYWDFHDDCLKQLHIICFIFFSFALDKWWYQKCLRKYSGDILLFFLPKMCLVICGGVEDKQLTT